MSDDSVSIERSVLETLVAYNESRPVDMENSDLKGAVERANEVLDAE